MKKTLYLAMVIALASAGTLSAEDAPTTRPTVEWTDISQAKTVNFVKDGILLINWQKNDGQGNMVTDTELKDLGGIDLTNGVINIQQQGQNSVALFNPNTPADNPDALVKDYSYGTIQLADATRTQLSKSNTSDYWAYAGALEMGENSEFIIKERQLAITNHTGVTMGAGSKITLGANLTGENPIQASLSLGASNDVKWPAVVITGADLGEGTITNTSGQTAQLSTDSASGVEFENTNITVHGNADEVAKTTINATLINANVFNATSGGTVVINGPVKEGTNSIKILSTGTGYAATQPGGDVVMLNRGSESLKMDALYIGEGHTVTSRQGADMDSTVGVIEMQAYDANKAENSDAKEAYALTADAFAALDADLILGTGDISTTTRYWSAMEISDYGKTDMNQGFGLDMMGNDLTLNTGITLGWQFMYHETTTKEQEALLFTNVDSLTLGLTKYQDEYFDYTAGIAAADFFSTEYDLESISYFDTELEQPVNGVGWYIEYRDNNKGDGTGDVYLAYRPATAQDNVPEPTTATLSLLALAGLAARRRRK